MSSNSTSKGRSRKAADRPKKPYPAFPLSPHASGTWQKKIRGKIHYFGRWARRVNGKLERIEGDGWKEALEEYKAVADDLHAGRTPRVKNGELTVADLCNHFLTAKARKVVAGELSARALMEYREITDLLVGSFGMTRLVDDLAGDDFGSLRATMAERWGPVRLGNAITRAKSVFKYGLDNGLLERVTRYGSEFRKPDKAVLRQHRAQQGEKLLRVDQLRQLIDAADVQLRAMILLGLNAGFGNGDCATLPQTALDLERGWLDYPRPKTGIARRCPLWPETAAAIREALAVRREPKAEANTLVFVNARGSGWIHFTAKGGRIDNITIQFTNLLKTLGMHRAGLGFYTLRHVFRTIADAARDPVAIDLIMGHTDPSMGGHYRERIEDSRLKAVAEHVRQWLFGKTDSRPTITAPEICDPSGPCDPDENGSGSEGAQGSQESEPGLSTDERLALRLYVG